MFQRCNISLSYCIRKIQGKILDYLSVTTIRLMEKYSIDGCFINALYLFNVIELVQQSN